MIVNLFQSQCIGLHVFIPHRLTESGTIRICSLVQGSVVLWKKWGIVGRDWMTHTFNPDLEVVGTSLIWAILSIGSVSLGLGLEVFFSSFLWCDSKSKSCCLKDVVY